MANLDPRDVRLDTWTGAGVAVRATHIPTGKWAKVESPSGGLIVTRDKALQKLQELLDKDPEWNPARTS